MKICSICHKISGTGQDHTDCVQKRRMEIEAGNAKDRLQEKLDLSKDAGDLGIEVKAILEHLAREKSRQG